MASAIEALGMTLPYNSSNPAVSVDKKEECERIGAAVRKLIELDLKPKDIVTRKSIENAVRLIAVLGGSTNAVLHFLAITRAAEIDFTIDDFQITDG
jgi:dihydroxy-acid dehydratase